MARARNIKPALFTNDTLAENDALGRLLFIGLWTIADFKGDVEWRPKRVKAQVLPYDDCDIEKLAINLDKSGFIRFYSDGVNNYLRVVNFSVHQNPHKNERLKGSDIPAYSESMRQAIDLQGLTINLDKSGLKRNDSASDRALSLIPYPDSLILNPDTLIAETGKGATKVAVDFSILNMTDEQVKEVKRIRKANKGGLITQRVANGLAKEFNQAIVNGFNVDHLLTEWETRGWKSFKFEWMGNNNATYQHSNGQPAVDKDDTSWANDIIEDARRASSGSGQQDIQRLESDSLSMEAGSFIGFDRGRH